MSEPFKAYVARKADKAISISVEEMRLDDLMAGDVTLRVLYSTVNFKDGLALTGKGKIFRAFPMIPGVDLAGEVVASDNPKWKTGDQVLLNSFGIGELHYGAYAGYARVRGEWLLPLPEGLDARSAMIHGTAGYTASLCVLALEEQGLTPDMGEVLVTGATGGVGSVAIMLLAKAGYSVIALTGKTSEEAYLKSLGASGILDRALLSEPNAKPLDHERWAGVVDTAGSHILANALSQMKYGGVVAATGLAQGMDLHTTVAPFILRGVRLIGVDSVYKPIEKRVPAWARLARDIPAEYLEKIAHDISFDDLPKAAETLMAGKMKGRYVVDMSGAR